MNAAPLVRLYPRRWRARYEDEMLAVLEARPADLLAVLDLALGAVDAHLDEPIGGRPSAASRLFGLAAVATGILLAVGLLVSLPEGWFGPRLILFYALGLVALVGLAWGQAPDRPVLAWLGTGPAILCFATGLVLVTLGTVLAPLVDVALPRLSFLAQLALWPSATWLAVTMLRIAVYSRLGALALLVGSPLAMLGLLGPEAGSLGGTAALLGLMTHAIGWVLVGVSLASDKRTYRLVTPP